MVARGSLECLDRLRVAPELPQRTAQLHPRRRVVRIDLEGPLERGDRLVKLAAQRLQRAQQGQARCVAGTLPHQLLEDRQGLVDPARTHQPGGEVVAHVGVVGRAPAGGAEQLDPFVDRAAFHEQRAERCARAVTVGIDLQRPAEGAHRLARLPGANEHVSHLGVNLGTPGIDAERVLHLPLRLGRAAVAHQGSRQREAKVDPLRIDADGAAQVGDHRRAGGRRGVEAASLRRSNHFELTPSRRNASSRTGSEREA